MTVWKGSMARSAFIHHVVESVKVRVIDVVSTALLETADIVPLDAAVAPAVMRRVGQVQSQAQGDAEPVPEQDIQGAHACIEDDKAIGVLANQGIKGMVANR